MDAVYSRRDFVTETRETAVDEEPLRDLDVLHLLGVTMEHVHILQLLMQRDMVSTAEMMGASGLTRGGVLNYLRVLEKTGLLSRRRQTHPRGSGPITYWSIRRDDVVDALLALVDVILADG